jgi:hypothetical protein
MNSLQLPDTISEEQIIRMVLDTADAMFGKTLAKRRETASIGQTSDKR